MNKFLIKLQLFITFQDNDLQKSPSICFSNINNLLAKLMFFSVGPFACRKESIIETMLLKHKRSKLVLSLIETPGFGPSSMGTDW